MERHAMKLAAHLAALSTLLVTAGCGGGKGSVDVFVEPEDTITGGLTAGTGDKDIMDGWSITYDTFFVVWGGFHAARSSAPDDVLSDPTHYVIDFMNVPAGGLVLSSFTDVTAEQWDKVGYEMPDASANDTCAEGISAADCEFMKTNGYSVYFTGSMTNPAGQSCLPTNPADCVAATTITFAWGLSAGTSFDDCGPEMGEAGFAVPTGGTVQVKPTIHGDHWVFDHIPGEHVTMRLAQWIANCDLDRDGEVTIAELGMVMASDVFPSPPYDLSGGMAPINTALDFLEEEVRTIGHYQGDGECPTRGAL